ncbi:MAG: ATP-grasp domain-containing protein, partial [Blautia sp.]|nr:ATP-grasp domain-containing protein [Blautia sp.]
MKRILMLGGNHFQMTATLAARELGYYIIDVDYLPDNPAHRFADEYHNISTIEKEKVLEKARTLNIDGIVSYASDISAPTAAYVAEALDLPTNTYDSVMILTHKDRFRSFLKEHGFPVPRSESFTAEEYPEALSFFSELGENAIVKPVDSSGSKGVDRVTSTTGLRMAWEEALSYSISGRVILEEFIPKKGYQIDGDIFIVDGKIRFWGICDQHHDHSCAPFAPVAHSFPSTQAEEYQNKAKEQLQRLLELLHIRMGACNVEYIIGPDEEIY